MQSHHEECISGIIQPHMNRHPATIYLPAILAAIFFGISTPLVKLLLGDVDPVILAGLLYLGAGLGMLVFRVIRSGAKKQMTFEASLKRADFWWLAGAIVAGGVLGPIAQMIGINNSPAATASLLLNFEAAATSLIAFLFFREHIGRRVWLGLFIITIASILLSLDLSSGWGFSAGSLLLLAACLFWGVDNNFTNRISAKDPGTIVMLKGLIAGSFSIALALMLGKPLPSWQIVLFGLLLGAVSYGVSVMLFVYSLRGLGAARTSAIFSTAPFIGVTLSLIIFGINIAWTFYCALALMLSGVWLLVGEKHAHAHAHKAITHDHRHRHDDDHHDHEHDEAHARADQSHSHVHAHEHQVHTHSHSPDIHHQHEHES